MRIGQGFDLHRLVSGRPFILGGIVLDWPKGPEGHSDGDVLLHAVTDALLGAAGLGDIGQWFPPSDDTYKNANSADLLRQAHDAVTKAGWRIINIDSTILLEMPKLGPYRDAIRDNIADILVIKKDQISIKAKTMEGLGPIGQQGAVGAMVSVLIESQ